MSELLDKLTLLSKASDSDLDHFRQAPVLPYHEESISIADTEELKSIIKDIEIYCENEDETLFFIPVHAWRALAQVNPSAETIVFLLEFVKNPYVDETDMDWFIEDLIKILEAVGEPAIQPIDEFLSNNRDNTKYLCAIESLPKIARLHTGLHHQCVAVVTKHFEHYEMQDKDSNAFLLSALLKLNAVLPNIDMIRAAFEADKINGFWSGDFEDIEIKVGLRTERSTPRKQWYPTFLNKEEADDDDEEEAIQLSNRTTPALSKKDKEKRKAKNKEAKKARKKNRKK